jgi:hypothetical protein
MRYTKEHSLVISRGGIVEGFTTSTLAIQRRTLARKYISIFSNPFWTGRGED